MRIFLHEITDQETELSFTQEDKWVADTVARVDEKADEGEGPALRHVPAPPSKSRPIEVNFSLRQVDEVVVVSGNIDTHIRLICSRCTALYPHPCKPRFSALFCKDPAMAGVGHLQDNRPAGQNKGFARHAPSLLETDLDITYISTDYIDLSDVLAEQLQLQVPFQPLCQEQCKGICVQCGADLNAGRCACAKIPRATPFSALKDLKI